MAKPIPQRLKKLESSDLLSIKDSNGDFLVVTKQETTHIIKEFIKNEVINSADDFSSKQRKAMEKRVEANLDKIEKSLIAFIDYKFDMLAEKACDMLITRKFNEEVLKKAEELITKKKLKGKF